MLMVVTSINVLDETRAGQDYCCIIRQAVSHQPLGTPLREGRRAAADPQGLLVLAFETNPLSKVADATLHLNALPLEVVYQASTIAQAGAFFAPPAALKALDDLADVAAASASALQESTATGLMYAIGNKLLVPTPCCPSSPCMLACL